MKLILFKVMKMNHIFRMTLVTCFRSFILVISYFLFKEYNPFQIDNYYWKGSWSLFQELCNPIHKNIHILLLFWHSILMME
uniref:Uncharacterized protein n=1 Tax=Monodelphis domestica TaxID=13616 RepID=A0A5F8GPR2_MONDO